MPFEDPGPHQQQDDEDDSDPEAGEPGPACVAGLDTDVRGEPVDPEGQPNGEDDDIDDMNRATPRPSYDGVS